MGESPSIDIGVFVVQWSNVEHDLGATSWSCPEEASFDNVKDAQLCFNTKVADAQVHRAEVGLQIAYDERVLFASGCRTFSYNYVWIASYNSKHSIFETKLLCPRFWSVSEEVPSCTKTPMYFKEDGSYK